MSSSLPFNMGNYFPRNFLNKDKEYESEKEEELVNLNVLIRPVEEVGISFRGFHHWILEAEFRRKCLYLQGNKDESGLLVPSVSEKYPSNIDREVHIGKVRISPYELVKLAIKNKYNYVKYDVLIGNCQIWAKTLAKELGIEDINIATVKRQVGLLSAGTTLIFGIPGAIASAAGVFALYLFSSTDSSATSSSNGKNNKRY